MVLQVDDQRVFDRFMARFPVKFRYSKSNFGTNVFLRDISAEGAKIVTKEEVNLNDNLELLVDLPDGLKPMILKGQVVWSRNTHPKTWDVGLAFDKIRLMHTRRIYKHCQ